MTENQEEYAINELAKKANVSVRTVRFYINEGLLPAPQTRGRYTVYSDEYVDRLELIRRLKESFLPLKEIRATVTSLNWEEVRTTLADLRRRETDQNRDKKTEAAHQVAESSSGALDYISDLLSSTPVSRPLPLRAPAPLTQANTVKPAEPPNETWQRIILAPGIEIHVRQPRGREDQQKIEEIIRLARKLFP